MIIKSIFSPKMKSNCLLPSLTIVLCLTISNVSLATIAKDGDFTKISRSYYAEKLQGFWLGQNIGNWTGLITEMDKVGTPETLPFYTDSDWGEEDLPAFWGEGPASRRRLGLPHGPYVQHDDRSNAQVHQH